MSFPALNAIWATDIRPTGQKLVALKLADHCNKDTNEMFVGMTAIAHACGISRSQAQRHVHALVKVGLLSVVRNQKGGPRGVVPHYRLNFERLSIPLAGRDTSATSWVNSTGRTSAAYGSHRCGDGVALAHVTGSTHATQTPINPQPTITEPSKKTRLRKASTVNNDLADLYAEVDDQVLKDWNVIRTKKKAPITRTALTAILFEASKAQLSLNEVLTLCCKRGWAGFEADWVRSDNRTTGKTTSKHVGFEKLDYREGINDDGSFV